MSIKQFPKPDQEIISRPDIYATLVEVWKENIRVESRGYVQDIEILMQDWGFRLHEIHKKVLLWQGEADANTPPMWARYMTKELPGCKAMFFAEEGHFVLFTHWKEILQNLIDD